MTHNAFVRAALATLFCGALFVATPQLEPPKLTISKVRDNLYVIEGDGGNTGVYVTEQGVILVDDKFPRDVEYILDHSGGNEKLLAQNVEIIAHRNARTNISW